jgi:hypothetical protein
MTLILPNGTVRRRLLTFSTIRQTLAKNEGLRGNKEEDTALAANSLHRKDALTDLELQQMIRDYQLGVDQGHDHRTPS